MTSETESNPGCRDDSSSPGRAEDQPSTSRPSLSRIYLVGFMGAGKTTIGRQMARILGSVFLDLDREIEMESGLKISEIFARFGEQHFRDLEARQLAATLELDNVIVATGGGVYARTENIETIRAGGGLTIWLDVPIEDLLERLNRHVDQRPLFKDDEQARELLESRRPFYRRADYRFALGGGDSPHRVARQIVSHIQQDKAEA